MTTKAFGQTPELKRAVLPKRQRGGEEPPAGISVQEARTLREALEAGMAK